MSSNKVLLCVQRLEAQRAHKEVLDNIRDAKEFDSEETSRKMIILGSKRPKGIRR